MTAKTMKTFVFILSVSVLLRGATEAPHIKAATVAYEDGKAAQHEKNLQGAVNSFRKAIDVEPTFMEARLALIGVHLESGHRLEAAAAITQLLEIDPDAAHYRIVLGQILLEQKQPERALAQFSFILKTDPYNADALLGFASAAKQTGMEGRASAALELGRKHYPLDDRFTTVPSALKHD